MALGRGTVLTIFLNFIIFFKKINLHQKEGAIVLEGFLLFGLIGSFIYNKFLHKMKKPHIFLIIFTLFG